MHIEWLKIKIIDLQCLKDFLATLEGLLQKESEDIPKRINTEAEKLTEKEKEDLYDAAANMGWELTKIFQNILRSSFFVACYSYYEHKRNHLQNCLSKEINFPDNDPSQKELKYFKWIRNFIIHNEGRLDNTDKAQKIRSYITKRSDISVDEENTIILSKEYCMHALNIIEAFFDALFSRLT